MTDAGKRLSCVTSFLLFLFSEFMYQFLEIVTIIGFPLGLENLKNRKTLSSQGILTRLEKSGKIIQNTQLLFLIFSDI